MSEFNIFANESNCSQLEAMSSRKTIMLLHSEQILSSFETVAGKMESVVKLSLLRSSCGKILMKSFRSLWVCPKDSLIYFRTFSLVSVLKS